MSDPWTQSAPLPGGDIEDADFAAWFARFREEHSWLPEALARHYGSSYGTDARLMLRGADSMPSLGTHFGAEFYEIEARWLYEREWARDAEDFIQRRTKHGLFMTDRQRREFASWCHREFAI